MSDSRDDKLDRLLAEGRLGGPRRDQIWTQVLATTAARRRRWRSAAVWLSSMATAAALFIVFLRPSSFRARGEGDAVLEVVCRDGSLDRCVAGSKLLFRVASAEGGFLSAWAEAEAGGTRVWYWPDSDGAAPQVAPSASPIMLPVGIEIGSEQPPGRYRIHLLLTRRPLTREECLAPPPSLTLAKAQATLGVVL
jgi:hypothetical protein